jgi:hypothetical protein
MLSAKESANYRIFIKMAETLKKMSKNNGSAIIKNLPQEMSFYVGIVGKLNSRNNG